MAIEYKKNLVKATRLEFALVMDADGVVDMHNSTFTAHIERFLGGADGRVYAGAIHGSFAEIEDKTRIATALEAGGKLIEDLGVIAKIATLNPLSSAPLFLDGQEVEIK